MKYGDYHMAGQEENVRTLMTLKEPSTAVFTANNLMALGTIRELNKLGFRVLQDVSVIGFDDIVTNEYTIPALTSVK